MRILILLFCLNYLASATIDDVVSELQTMNTEVAKLEPNMTTMYNKMTDIEDEIVIIKNGLAPWRDDSLLMMQVMMIIQGLMFGCYFWYYWTIVRDLKDFN